MLPGPPTDQIARAAGTMMIAFVLSQVLGLVRSILMTRAFGTGAEADAFTAATRLSDILFNLVAGGALASAFVPTFTGFLSERRPRGRLEAGVRGGQPGRADPGRAGGAVGGVCPLDRPDHPGPGFPPGRAGPDRLAAAGDPALGGHLRGERPDDGLPNAHQRFFLPALASSMYWLGMIFGIVLADPLAGHFWTGLGGAGGRGPAPGSCSSRTWCACPTSATGPIWGLGCPRCARWSG